MEGSTTTTAPAEPAEDISGASVGSDGVPEGTEASSERDETGRYLSRKAAGYRRRLRDVEAERDSVRERLERYERPEVERLAGAAGLQVPGDIWQFGASLDALRGDDGSIDSETVNGLVAEIVKDRPGLQAQQVGDLGIGRGASAASTQTSQRVGLSQLLKPGRT